MAQTMSSASVGRVNRRFLFLALILATLSAVLVYAAVSRSGGSSGGGGGSGAGDVPVVVAKVAIAPGTTITADLLELRQLPADAVGNGAFSTVDAAVGQVARYPVEINEPVLSSSVIGGLGTTGNDALSLILEGGKRGIAIHTDSIIGAGGLVLPGDRVDILWFPDNVEQDQENASLLAENVEIVAVAQTLENVPPAAPGAQTTEGESTTTADQQRVRTGDQAPIPDAGTVTVMVTPDQARLIFCAERSGGLRMAVRAVGDNTPSGVAPATCIIKADQLP